MLVLTWMAIISHITELTRINSPLLLAASSNDFRWRDSHAPLEEQAEGLAPALGTVLLWRRLLGHSWPAILSCSWNHSLTCSWSLWGWLRLLATLGLTVLVTWCGARLYMPATSCRRTCSVACSAGVALEQTPPADTWLACWFGPWAALAHAEYILSRGKQITSRWVLTACPLLNSSK